MLESCSDKSSQLFTRPTAKVLCLEISNCENLSSLTTQGKNRVFIFKGLRSDPLLRGRLKKSLMDLKRFNGSEVKMCFTRLAVPATLLVTCREAKRVKSRIECRAA